MNMVIDGSDVDVAGNDAFKRKFEECSKSENGEGGRVMTSSFETKEVAIQPRPGQ